jgi:hypothetical protein
MDFIEKIPNWIRWITGIILGWAILLYGVVPLGFIIALFTPIYSITTFWIIIVRIGIQAAASLIGWYLMYLLVPSHKTGTIIIMTTLAVALHSWLIITTALWSDIFFSNIISAIALTIFAVSIYKKEKEIIKQYLPGTREEA